MGSSKFCSNLFIEILSRTNLKSLDQCKSVCKEFYDLSYDPSFKPLHRERSNTISGYFVQCQIPLEYVHEFASMDKSTQVSLQFLPRAMKIHTKILATSRQGILCCLSYEHKKYCFYVCKPSSQQWRILPNPKMRYHTEKVAMVVSGSNQLCYKVVRLSKPKCWMINNNNFHCEIFDSNTWRWKKLADIFLPDGAFFDNQPAVVVNRSIFWLLTNDFVINFDITTETYTLFSLPKILLEEEMSYQRTKQLIEYKGNLAFITQAEHLIMWVLEDYTNYIWGLRKKLSLKEVRERESYAKCVGFSDADVAVMTGHFRVIFYNYRNSTMQIVDTKNDIDELFLIRSDSETIELSGRS